jgi:hypothetical protein
MQPHWIRKVLEIQDRPQIPATAFYSHRQPGCRRATPASGAFVVCSWRVLLLEVGSSALRTAAYRDNAPHAA